MVQPVVTLEKEASYMQKTCVCVCVHLFLTGLYWYSALLTYQGMSVLIAITDSLLALHSLNGIHLVEKSSPVYGNYIYCCYGIRNRNLGFLQRLLAAET